MLTEITNLNDMRKYKHIDGITIITSQNSADGEVWASAYDAVNGCPIATTTGWYRTTDHRVAAEQCHRVATSLKV